MINETATFFDLNDFAEIVTCNGRRIKAIFDKLTVSKQEGFTTVVGQHPQIVCQTSEFDLSAAVQGDLVVVRRVNYEIVNIEPDGTGISTISLYEKIA
jgi:hypothetical protein